MRLISYYQHFLLLSIVLTPALCVSNFILSNVWKNTGKLNSGTTASIYARGSPLWHSPAEEKCLQGETLGSKQLSRCTPMPRRCCSTGVHDGTVRAVSTMC